MWSRNGIVIKLVCALLVLVFSLPLHATKIYKWTDPNGVTHFSTDPPPGGGGAETLTLPGQRTAGPAPSPRVRQIRCRDFRGAVDQLAQLDPSDQQDPRWQAANTLAEQRIAEWCEN